MTVSRFLLAPMCGIVVLTTLALASGCRPPAEIRTYRVPKTPSATAERRAVAEPTHRMLAAVVPLNDQAWFFKAVATIEQMDRVGLPIEEFFQSLTPADDGQLNWKLPDHWREEPGSNDLRLATITLPDADESIEIAVSRMPWTGDGPGGLLANVNRWRGQMGLAPVGPAELGECTRELRLGDHTGTLVDLRGQFSAGGMSASLAPAATQPPPPAAAPPVPAPREFQFATPTGWQSLPASGFRKAAFVIDREEGQAEVTAMDFPTGGTAMGDPLANVNRWLGELGRESVDQAEMDEMKQAVRIDGLAGALFELTSDAPLERPMATLAAMVEREGKVWFFKMRGDRDLVTAQSDNFRAFLDSVKFEPSTGGEHGDD